MEEAFEWYSSLATDLKVASVPASSSDIPWGEQQFVAGNVAMAVDGSWNLLSNADSAAFSVGVVTLPQGPNGGGTYSANSGFGISATCENKDEAAKAISVLTGAEGSANATAQGNEPARTADEPAFIKSLADTIDSKNPGYSAQVESALAAGSENAVPFVSTDGWDQTTKAIAREFILSYTDSQTPEQSLKNVQDASQ